MSGTTHSLHVNGNSAPHMFSKKERCSRDPLHRLPAVRRQEGISQRSMARRLGISVSALKSQEDEFADLRLSTIRKWSIVLKVPVAELLLEPEDGLAPHLETRGRLVRVMKTAKALVAKVRRTEARRLADMLVDQLVDIFPELKEVGPWHSVGKRRTDDELGRVAQYPFPEDLLCDFKD